MTRRAAFLMSWGVAYAFLGAVFVTSGTHFSLWGWLFGGAGVIAIFAAVTRPMWLDSLGFMFLAMSAVAQSGWHFTKLISTQEEASIHFFLFIVWGSVGVAQVIASGFPDYPLVQVIESEESIGEPN